MLVCAPIVAVTGFGGPEPDNFLIGFPRVVLLFWLGILVFHIDRKIGDWKGWTAVFWLLAACMAFLFYFPVQVPYAVYLGWVIFPAPVLVRAGARARYGSRLTKLGILAGALSYPIYVLSYPCSVGSTARSGRCSGRKTCSLSAC